MKTKFNIKQFHGGYILTIVNNEINREYYYQSKEDAEKAKELAERLFNK